MIKLDIFVEIGEMRKPRDGEWFRGILGTWYQYDKKYDTDEIEYPIGVLRYAEAPTGAIGMIPKWVFMEADKEPRVETSNKIISLQKGGNIEVPEKGNQEPIPLIQLFLYPELLDKLTKAAKAEWRTPEGHAAYLIEKALEG